MPWSLLTDRLKIRFAMPDDLDISFLLKLWKNPKVMTFVGYPNGFNTSYSNIKSQLSKPRKDEFDRVLIVSLKDNGECIGMCELGSLDENSIAHTDVKLHPDFWGNKYGVEIKKALVNYIFEHTDAVGIEATPNQKNSASIKMQKAVGAVKTGEGVYKFPEEMSDYTCDVPYYEYIVYRKEWENINK